MTYEEVLERLPAFALGALEADEMQEIEAYLNNHHELVEQLGAYDDALVSLARSLPEVVPPPLVREQLMARVYEEVGRDERRSGVTAPAPSWWERLGTLFGPAQRGALGAAMLLLLLVLGVGSYRLQQSLAQAESRLAAVEGRNVELSSEVERLLEARLTEEQIALLSGAQQRVQLPGTDAAPNATGTLFAAGDEGLLLLSGLDELEATLAYQLWLIPADGDPVSAGVLALSPDIGGLVAVTLPDSVEEFAAVGLSVEPEGGSVQPTGPIVLLGEVG